VMLQHFNEDAVVLQGGKPVGSVRMERLEHEPKLCPCSLEGFQGNGKVTKVSLNAC
jgi:hypothetical protein